MNTDKIFAERLAYYRQQKGLRQKDLAEALGTGTTTVSGWELGNFTPKLPLIYEICRVLDISVSALLEPDMSNSDAYTQEEQAIMAAYREHPEMQTAVKTLLGMK